MLRASGAHAELDELMDSWGSSSTGVAALRRDDLDTARELAPRDELPALRQRRLDSFLTFLGPGGFAVLDDIEALESCQQGFRSGGVEWNDLSRGMSRDPHTDDEEQMRSGGAGASRRARGGALVIAGRPDRL